MATPIDIHFTFRNWFEQQLAKGIFKEKHRERAFKCFSAGVHALIEADKVPQTWCWTLPPGIDVLPREFDLLFDLKTVSELKLAIDCAEDGVIPKPLFDLCVAYNYIRITY